MIPGQGAIPRPVYEYSFLEVDEAGAWKGDVERLAPLGWCVSAVAGGTVILSRLVAVEILRPDVLPVAGLVGGRIV